MGEWTKVVTDTLGLAGFALFLVFGYLAKVKRSDERRWFSLPAVAVPVGVLAVGLALAYVRIPKPVAPPPKPANPQRNSRQTRCSNHERSRQPKCAGGKGGCQYHG
jgi:hypothetical protein